MSENISRRDFIKLAGITGATAAVLTGCGPASRYVVREPYTKMPEYTYNGQSTHYATTCRECSAGCGLVVRTMQGRAIKVEGNKYHPANLGKTCARGQAGLHGLYNPDRLQNPVDKSGTNMDWEAAIGVVADTLGKYQPDEIAFLTGLAPDHLFDLFGEVAKAFGIPAPLRYGALGMFEARATLGEAARALFGQPNNLFFDLAEADVTFSFGANFLETWIAPVAYTRGFAKMRQGTAGKRGYLVHFEPRLSQTAVKADEWFTIKPGSEGLLALALGKLIAEQQGKVVAAYESVDVAAAVEAAGLELETLERLARIYGNAKHALAIPGAAPLAQTNGLDAAKAILSLNVLAGNLGQPGGVFLTPAAPVNDAYHRPVNAKELAVLIEKMVSGQIKALFVHGVNPVFEIPAALGFSAALDKVETVISFASFPDETAAKADYVFPDHTGLESWGYQRLPGGAGESTLSGSQPVVAPFYDTRATADVLLAAAEQAGKALPYKDEVAFIQAKIEKLVTTEDGFYSAAEINTFWAQFQQFGGWWTNEAKFGSPTSSVLEKALSVREAEYEGEGEFHLFTYVSPILGEAGANKPWLQEVPDPVTTVMWNSWVEINPYTAKQLGLHDDDVVRIVSPFGAVEVSVYLYPAIRPDVIAMPFGQGHTAYGRYAEGRGVNPADLFGTKINDAGDLAYAGLKVKIEKTGKTRPLSRLESRIGVYGFEEH
jgi:anaerobic selenocysteine-containing dehydrogenase